VPVLESTIDRGGEDYATNRAALLALMGRHAEQLALSQAGGASDTRRATTTEAACSLGSASSC
jgi:hypothetical protein